MQAATYPGVVVFLADLADKAALATGAGLCYAESARIGITRRHMNEAA